jgi:type II secretory ATPase GspE/PulE/Tfp pilus assembly ATPase PilB-like protein
MNQPVADILNMDLVRVDPAVALKLPPALALRRKVLPFAVTNGQVYVACLDVADTSAVQVVEKFVSAPVRLEAAEPESLARALDRVYGDLPGGTDGRGKPRSVDVRNFGDLAAPDAVALGDEVMHAALLRQASDIHLEPGPTGLTVRIRVDGELEITRKLPASAAVSLVSRLKVLAGLDIAEKRAPQDGGFRYRYGRGTQTVDVRVATLPTKHGERMTLRLLALQTESLTLERLGMCAADFATFERAISLSHGMILLTGPTGSGKTTTLYAAIRRLLERETLNVITVEDPIEYEIAGVSQVEVDSADKVSFLKALRSALRHDPDVVMIGEIRDAETADVAIKASLTGHLVFSTLHTNSAASVVTRLVDMGVERYLIAATLRLAAAQRLVRRLCPRCRKPRPMTAAEAAALGRPEAVGREVSDPGGCVYCGGRGYAGRIGLFELLPFAEELTRAIADGASEGNLAAIARQQKVPRLADDGLAKLLNGEASAADVAGAVNEW